MYGRWRNGEIVEAEFGAKARGEEPGVEQLLEEHLLAAPLPEGDTAIVLARGGDVDGAGEWKRFELAAVHADGIAELEMAAVDHEEVALGVGHLAGEVRGLAMDEGGGAADLVEVAASVEPWAAGGVDISVGDVPSGVAGVFAAPLGEAAVDTVVGIGKHDVAGGEVAGGDHAALQFLVLVKHAGGGGALRDGEIVLDDREVGMAEGHSRGLVADEEKAELSGGLGADGAQRALAQGGDERPIGRGERALERHDENEHGSASQSMGRTRGQID